MTVLAHPGGHAVDGGPPVWAALVVLVSLGLVVVWILVVARRIRPAGLDDLLVPAAIAVVLAAAAAAPLRLAVGDWFAWAAPAGVVLLIGLGVAALGTREPGSFPVVGSVAAIATVAAVGLGPLLQIEPTAELEMIPLAGEAEVQFVDLEDGTVLDAGRHTFTVAVDGGTIGPPVVPDQQLPEDATQLGHVRLFLDGEPVPTANDRGCTVGEPCSEVEFDLTLAPGPARLRAEFVSAEGSPFAPMVTTTVEVEVR